MANGSHKLGPAQADRIREETDKHKRYLQRMIDEERARGELPSYNDDEPSEITMNTKLGSVGAKLGLPRLARNAIGLSLAALLVGLTVALVRVAWRWL